jgi:holo-[acyl-carrier protein] synthase
MIIGIGIDLIEVERIQSAMKRKGFLERYFTEKEIMLFEEHKMNPLKIAGNFSTKEAIVKMFGRGFRNIRLKDIEVLRDNLGKPTVHLEERALELSKQLEIDSIHVSISNTKAYVTALAIGEKL